MIFLHNFYNVSFFIYMKKLVDSAWLRAVQFKCSARAKTVQITHPNSRL